MDRDSSSPPAPWTVLWQTFTSDPWVLSTGLTFVASVPLYLLSLGDWIGELKQVTKDGAEIVVESWWTLVSDNDGNPTSKLIVSSDVTAKARADILPA